jgi:hypothetical protein
MRYKTLWRCDRAGIDSYEIIDSTREYHLEVIAECELKEDADNIITALNMMEDS